MHMPTDEPLVSISCVTYNHEAFIADALEGFLKQQTPFPVEILIHEDASTDRTGDIVRGYARRYPGKINAICQQENKYSKGIRVSHFNYARARGKYIALCEGDDFWTDPLKLAKQVQAMEANPDVRLCFHPARRIPHGSEQADRVIGRYAREDGLIPVEDIIKRSHGSIPTASCLIRRSAIEDLLELRERHPDLRAGQVIQILASYPGGALYLNEEMSVYRYRIPGSWSSRNSMNSAQDLRHIHERITAGLIMDAHFNHELSRAFSHAIRRTLMGVAKAKRFSLQQKRDFIQTIGPHLSLSARLGYAVRMLWTAEIHRTNS